MARPKKVKEEVVTEVVEEITEAQETNESIVDKNGVKVVQWTDENGVTFVRPL